jgi:hypothetical protein
LHVSAEPLKHLTVVLEGRTVPVAVPPKVNVEPLMKPLLLNATVATPPVMVTTSLELGDQPLGVRCAVTVPGYSELHPASMQAFTVTTFGLQVEAVPSCSMRIWLKLVAPHCRPKFMSALTSEEDNS